ncbi:MAG: hypothetical protein AB7O26_19290 [Planctomycetaceae bacterium]
MILGEPDGLLARPSPAMRSNYDWSQRDSDIIAHFLQVQRQIHSSRWNKSKIQFESSGNTVLNHSFPIFEDFVFVAVYFRQLIAGNDSLMKDAVNRYRRVVDSPIHALWMKNELSRFNKQLSSNALMLDSCTVRELFDAFLYGAGLMHKMPKEGSPKRTRFLALYDNVPKHRLLYSLNISLKCLMNHVGNVAIVLYRDFAKWVCDHKLPLPDTRWHDKLFTLSDGIASGPAS